MNSANCAYHRLQLLVLIAAVTTRLERRWVLLLGAYHRQVILICGLFMSHSRANCLADYCSKTSEPGGLLYTRAICFFPYSASIKDKLSIQLADDLKTSNNYTRKASECSLYTLHACPAKVQQFISVLLTVLPSFS